MHGLRMSGVGTFSPFQQQCDESADIIQQVDANGQYQTLKRLAKWENPISAPCAVQCNIPDLAKLTLWISPGC